LLKDDVCARAGTHRPIVKERQLRLGRRFALVGVAGLLSVLVVAAGEGESARSHSGAVGKTACNETLKKAIIVDGAGHTLYMFTSDIGGQGIYKIWYVLSAKGTPIK